MSRIAALADAVVAYLVAKPLTPPAGVTMSIERSYFFPVRPEDVAAECKVYVFPAPARVAELEGRRTLRDQITVQVGVTRKLTGNGQLTNANVDPMMALMDRIIDLLTRAEVSPDARWIATTQDPTLDYAALQQQSVFISLVSVTYQMEAEID